MTFAVRGEFSINRMNFAFPGLSAFQASAEPLESKQTYNNESSSKAFVQIKVLLLIFSDSILGSVNGRFSIPSKQVLILSLAFLVNKPFLVRAKRRLV